MCAACARRSGLSRSLTAVCGLHFLHFKDDAADSGEGVALTAQLVTTLPGRPAALRSHVPSPWIVGGPAEQVLKEYRVLKEMPVNDAESI